MPVLTFYLLAPAPPNSLLSTEKPSDFVLMFETYPSIHRFSQGAVTWRDGSVTMEKPSF